MLQPISYLINGVVTLLYRFRRRPDGTLGAHAIAITPERKIVLVKLRYAKGWRLPGGGRSEDESLEDAVLRELREEIGMTGYSRVREAPIGGLLIVDDVRYRPRKWSWEVEAVSEASIDDLPPDLSRRSRDWLKAARDAL